MCSIFCEVKELGNRRKTGQAENVACLLGITVNLQPVSATVCLGLESQYADNVATK